MVPPSIEPEGKEPAETRTQVSISEELLANGIPLNNNDDRAVPLRELLQNASDAVQARRALEPGFAGSVEVGLSTDLCELTVCDDGVGMAADVLTGALIDSGHSLWRSEELANVHPGLREAGFEPAGKFGVGFSSAFLWADEVRVVSRPRNQGAEGTRVLLLTEGPTGDLLLRDAGPKERLPEPGTQVRLRMRDGEGVFLELLGLARDPGDTTIGPLVTKLQSMAPAYDVDLRAVVGGGEPRTVLTGGDWQSIAPDRLLARIATRPEGDLKAQAKRVSLIGPAGGPRGRIAFSDSGDPLLSRNCVLVEGGLRVGATGGFVGVLAVEGSGSPDGVRLVADREEIASWATFQASANDPADGDALNLSAKVLMLGGDTGPTPLAESAKGMLTRDELLKWIGERRRILLVDVFERFIDEAADEKLEIKDERLTAHEEGEEWEERSPWFDEQPNPCYGLSPDALNITGLVFGIFRGGLRPADLPAGFVQDGFRSIEEEVMHLAAMAWNCDVDEIEIAEEPSADDLIEVKAYGPILSYGIELTPPRGAGR